MSKKYGDWKVLRSLGEGGQAWTHLARHADSREGVLKVIKNPKREWRFERETVALGRLRSTNVPALLDVGETDGRPWLVSSYVGRPLLDVVSNLGLAARLEVFRGVANAIRDAHRAGIVHRDLKPSNVVVQDDAAFLVDFGICALSDAGPPHTTAEAFGNAAFAAPECFLGSGLKPVPASDVYSAGKLLYWLASVGGVIHREQTDGLSVEWPPAYLSLRARVFGLIRSCVRERAQERPDADTLLQRAQLLCDYVEEVDAEKSRGFVRLVDNIDKSGEFNRGSQRSAVSPEFSTADLHPSHQVIGEIPGNIAQAECLHNHFGQSVRVTEIALGMSCLSHQALVEVQLVNDLDGSPAGNLMGAGQLLLSQGPARVHHLSCDILVQAGDYWVVVRSAGELPAYANVHAASWNVAPQRSVFAESLNGGATWQLDDSPNGPGIAVRVTAALEPA